MKRARKSGLVFFWRTGRDATVSRICPDELRLRSPAATSFESIASAVRSGLRSTGCRAGARFRPVSRDASCSLRCAETGSYSYPDRSPLRGSLQGPSSLPFGEVSGMRHAAPFTIGTTRLFSRRPYPALCLARPPTALSALSRPTSRRPATACDCSSRATATRRRRRCLSTSAVCGRAYTRVFRSSRQRSARTGTTSRSPDAGSTFQSGPLLSCATGNGARISAAAARYQVPCECIGTVAHRSRSPARQWPGW